MPCSKEEFLWNVRFHPWSGTFLPSPGCSRHIRWFTPLTRTAKPAVASMDTGNEDGCCLTLCRTGSSQRMDSKYMAVAPEFGYRVLQYLCENGVQPEIWQDVVAELDAAQQTEQEGGAWRGQ